MKRSAVAECEATGATQRPQWTRSTGIALFFGAVLLPLCILFALPDILGIWIRYEQGGHFGADRATRTVRERGPLLARVLALCARDNRSQRGNDELRELAAELGAIEIRVEQRGGESCPTIVFHRWWIGETYEEQLAWVPAALATAVRSGTDRLGERFEFVADGWWWVWW